MTYYTGPVCFVAHDVYEPRPALRGGGLKLRLQGGFHYTVERDRAGDERPGRRLVCEDTAGGAAHRFRLATRRDVASWGDRKHSSVAVFVATPLDEEEQAAVASVRRSRGR